MQNFDRNIKAELVWDGTDEVRMPAGMEPPCPDQMQGTAHDRLGELCCRTCYDSSGIDPKTKKRKGRTTDELHTHILAVKNYNVYEHADFTVRIQRMTYENILCCLINRPGVWCELTPQGIEVTMNHRCVLEWDKWSTNFGRSQGSHLAVLGEHLWNHARTLAPKVYPEDKPTDSRVTLLIPKVDDLTENQASISLCLSFSRGCGNEQCRHRKRMSQRSTRFVDESDSPYVEHPLLTQFLCDDEVGGQIKDDMRALMGQAEKQGKVTYMRLVTYLQEYLRVRGVEGTQARKQARGAARGYLGLALHTEMIFTATVADWLWMLSQRGVALADAEIRVLYSPQVLRCLQASRYGHFFSHLQVADAPDGVGQIVVDGKNS